MKLFILSPEVAGGLGPATKIGNLRDVEERGAVPRVTSLEYRFDSWRGDEILGSHPCFIITRRLGSGIRSAGLSGISFGRARVNVSGQFQALHPHKVLPPFEWLLPLGRVEISERNEPLQWSGHSVCVSQRGGLVVDEKALAVIQRHKAGHCGVVAMEIASPPA